MATETLAPLAPAFPRPTSLYVPERLADPVLDHSSYSPFPTIPGSNHARDPHGLNAFLLHPTDALWDYMHPAPATLPSSTSTTSVVRTRSVSAAVLPAESTDLEPIDGGIEKPSLKKQLSLDQLPPIAPSSESPVSSTRDPAMTLVRRRSKSVGSPSMLRKELEMEDSPTVSKSDIANTRPRTKSLTPKSLKSALHKARKSLLGTSPASSRASSVASSPRVSDDANLPAVPYSSSNSSDSSNLSATSSSSSSEGNRTPASTSSDHVAEPVAIKLADALEEGAARKSWLGWLGGRRGPKSRDTTPSSSRGGSPNASSANLSKVPSPERTTPGAPQEPVSRVSPKPSPHQPKTYHWVGEELRRSSLRKAAALRRPSPHPLARQLARQVHLPQEVAMALRAELGQRTYPRSVNSPSYTLAAGEGGLRVTLGIRAVLLALDGGQLPPGTFTSPSPGQNTQGKKGMQDFVNRQPFENRMLVFYPDDKFSKVSMARPGFGIWDLDFSGHVLALAALHDGETPARTPRASFHSEVEGQGSTSGLAGEADPEVEILITPPPVDEGGFPAPIIAGISPSPSTSALPLFAEGIEELVSPLAKITAVPTGKTERPDDIQSSFRTFVHSTPPKTRPLSSFHNASKAKSASEWDNSDSDEFETPEDAAEDEKPLAMVMKRNVSMPALTLSSSATRSRPTSTLASLPSQRELPCTRPMSQLDPKRTSKRASTLDPVGAMKEVALARQRREAARSGEVERMAEAAIQREKEAKRQSSAMPPKRASMSTSQLAKMSSGSSSPASPPRSRDDARRRTRSTFEVPASRPAHVRTSTAPTLGTKSAGQRRVQSVYDLPTLPSYPVPLHPAALHNRQSIMPLAHSHSFYLPPQGMVYAHSQAIFHSPPMVYAPTMPHSHSMTFRPPPGAYRQPANHSRSAPQEPARQ